MNTSRTLLAVLAFFLTLLSDFAFLLLPKALQQPPLSEQLSGKILRLHIIADNDSDEAQAVKLLVRDAVCEYLSPLPEGIDSKKEVCAYLSLHLSELITIADNVLQQNNCTYHASAAIEKRYFPLKTYGAYAFPPGEYDALCIISAAVRGRIGGVLHSLPSASSTVPTPLQTRTANSSSKSC